MKYYNLALDDVIRRLPPSSEVDKELLMQGCIALAPRSGSEPDELILAYYSAAASGQSEHQEQNYGEVRLIREVISLARLRARLELAVESGSLALAEGVNVELERTASMELLPSDDPASNLGPRFAVELPAKRRGNLSGAGPLVRFGQLSYASVEQAVRAWIPLRPFHGSSDARLGRIILEMPLSTPRLAAIESLNAHSLRVGFEKTVLDKLVELTGVWQSADASVVLPFAHPARGEPIEIARPAWADRIALWLTADDSQVRDYFSEDAYHCSRRRRVLYPGESNRAKEEVSVLAQIRTGEDERVEFKPFIKLDSSKAEELVRTVIAFANKHGGTLYLGVSDYQEIDGVERELREFAPPKKRASLADCATWYCATIRKRIGDRVSSAVVLECDSLEVCGKWLIRVTVMEAKAKPCCDVSTKEIWTRRGANTVRPDPSGDELKQLINGSSQVSRLFEKY